VISGMTAVEHMMPDDRILKAWIVDAPALLERNRF
jgi:hypothetical protein